MVRTKTPLRRGYNHTDYMPSKPYLEERLKYDPETGRFTWPFRPAWQFRDRRTTKNFNARHKGKEAGYQHTPNQILITIDYFDYRAEQIAYIMFHGICPTKVGFRNNDRLDLRINNLFAETDGQIMTDYLPKKFILEQAGFISPESEFSPDAQEKASDGRLKFLRDREGMLKTLVNAYPPPEYAQECIEYDPQMGEFKWKARPASHFGNQRAANIFNGRFAGKSCGHPAGNRVLQIGINGTLYKADLLAFPLMDQPVPLWVVHKNDDSQDLRWENLVGIYPEDLQKDE